MIFLQLGLVPTAAAAQGNWPRTWSGEDLAGNPCFVGYSSKPRDYRDRSQENHKVLRTVESFHFDQFAGGTNPRANGIGDLDYTLAWFPNHHLALFTVIRLATESAYKGVTAADKRYEMRPECRLQLAENLFPKDAKVQLLFGLYLQRTGRLEDAHARYERGLAIQPDAAEGHYNFGLLLLEMDRAEEAREHAKKAYRLGYPLQGLKRKLAKAGFPL